jgi:FlgD Ig-like domain
MRGTHKRFALLVVVALVSAMCMASTAYARSAPLGVTITSISPNPFTPNGDGHADKTNIYVRLASTQNIALYIENARGTTIDQHRFGLYNKGTTKFTWGGRTQAGKLAPNGLYTVVVKTTASSRHGQASATVRLGPKPTPAPRTTDTITYRVTEVGDGSGDPTTAFITLQTPTGSTQVDVQTPWQRTYTFKRGEFVYVSPQNDGGGSVGCSIVANGKTISNNIATGDFAIATCDGDAP